MCAEVHGSVSEKPQMDPIVCYYLLLNGLRHIHKRAAVLSLSFFPSDRDMLTFGISGNQIAL